MDEWPQIVDLIDCLACQSHPFRKAVFCVNQPDHWWNDEAKKSICENNLQTINYLRNQNLIEATVIDRSSSGKGWDNRHYGVGWARKLAMDAINTMALPGDLIVSMDADTFYPPDYLSSLVANLSKNPDSAGFALPYYHRLTGDEQTDRAMLRYEIYMRYYACNLWRCRLPYRFTAIGSALATTVRAYRHVNGITPHKSGEDFYFLLKLAKTGKIVTRNEEMAYPAARFSDRVFFGTGPAMIKGRSGDWTSYPFYSPMVFDQVAQAYQLLPSCYNSDIENPFYEFVNQQLNTVNLFAPLRKNHKDTNRFVKAATERLDALRVLQYLRQSGVDERFADEEMVCNYLRSFHATLSPDSFSFDHSPIMELDRIRDIFNFLETEYQRYE